MIDEIKYVFEEVAPLSAADWKLIKSGFKAKEVPAKHILTSPGETERHLYFVQKGLLRLLCHNPKYEEVTIFLFKENHFASSYQSFLTQTPSNQALETLEDCVLYYIDKSTLDLLYTTVPVMNIISRIIAEQRFINAQKIFSSHILHTPEERYIEFEKNHGDLLLRVPHHIIASFLGMTPVSMSRIRKRIYKK